MADEKVYTSLLREILTTVDNQFGVGLGTVERMNIALTILQEMAKDRRMQQIHDERSARAPGQQKLKSWRADPVTPDQLAFLS